MKRWSGYSVVVVALVLASSCSPVPPSDDDDDDFVGGSADAAPGRPDPDPDPYPQPDAGTTPDPDPDPDPDPGLVAPGGVCSCDADCESVGGHAGICVYGVCMTRASADCSAAGSTLECGAGSRCWGLQGEEGSICWPDCDSYTCAGSCDSDGSCVPSSGMDCGYTCGAYCACEAGDCGDGMTCVGGECVPETSGEGPGPGPGPTCPGLPTRDCTGGEASCGALVTFSPRATPHYDDYPINGETAANQYRSYLRRDLMMLLDYATAKTECKTEAWDSGVGGALGLGDMSEDDGAIPGTSVGSPGHPANTHVNGYDIDLGYYQTATDNRLRPICEHTSGGTDAYHCTGDPVLLDVWRTAFFLGTVFESSRVRVIGVDGRVGPLVSAAIEELCASGWLTEYACSHISLAYEETDMGYGWYRFHHHHAHVSLERVGAAPEDDAASMPCMQPGCGVRLVKPHPRRSSLGR